MTITDTECALLAAIAANPAEDTVRLVYADWLDENGDPDRAEFVRVQVELARLGECRHIPRWKHASPAGCPVCRGRGRESALLAANREKWLRVLCPKCEGSGRVHVSGAPTVSSDGTNAECPDCDGTGDIGELTKINQRELHKRYEVAWQRGFPFAVGGCRFADVFSPYEDDSHYEWMPTPWLLRVLRHHPTIERVLLVDKRSEQLGPQSWFWHHEDALHSIATENVLPLVVWDAIREYAHATPELATDVLARTVVVVGREWLQK